MPSRKPRSQKGNKRSKPYLGKARKESRIPLDPKYLVQRSLNEPSQECPVARLKSNTKHPTVFRKRILKVDSNAQHGDLVKVVADSGETVGYGYWNPRAEATIRIMSWGEQILDQRWWQASMQAAVSLRTEWLALSETTNAYRLINAEGDGIPGLIADVYGDVLSVQAYTLGIYQRAEAIAQALAKMVGVSHWVVRTGPRSFEQEGFVADGFESGKTPQRVTIKEGPATFEINPFEGHKTGFFCDQRENRLRLAEFCKGKRVLDLCCYSAGFSVHAALAGARQVTAIDIDEEALSFARRNAEINKAKIRFQQIDAFVVMRDLIKKKHSYDVIILDPPKLIRGRDEMKDGQNKYFDLNQLASQLVSPGGLLLTCSCSGLLSMNDFTMTVRAATAERQPRLLLRSGAGPDHPVKMNCLETEYLKCLWLQMPYAVRERVATH